MAQPSKQQIHAFRSAKTVRIVVNQSYSMAKGVWLWPENRLVVGESYGIAKGVSLPFEDITKRFLRHAGLRILTGTEGYDLMVKIEAKGQAISSTYEGGFFFFNGASLSGSILLETQSGLSYQKNFEGFRSPPPSVQVDPHSRPSSLPADPRGAPFSDVFDQRGSFMPEIAEVI